MAAYISVPRDLTKVKSKVAFNLTKRQLLCFGTAALIGVPLFFCSPGFRRQHCRHPRHDGGDAAGVFLECTRKMVSPGKLLSHYVQARFLRPKIRPYKTNNYYAILMKGGMTHDSVLEKDR